ncbi:hypothetical protein N665_0725s0001 [Sinapis alba]|nr:hypothetical protein N665_0725s0001 [Sinapis alba]
MMETKLVNKLEEQQVRMQNRFEDFLQRQERRKEKQPENSQEEFRHSQRRHIREKEDMANQRDELASLKLKIPPFYGQTDPYAYLEWKKKIDLVINCQQYTPAKKIQVAATEFNDYALSWWDHIVTTKMRNGGLKRVEMQHYEDIGEMFPKAILVEQQFKRRNNSQTGYGEHKEEAKPRSIFSKDKGKAVASRTNDMCKGRGHCANECTNKRVMILLENGELESSDEAS